MAPERWATLLGQYAATRALRSGEVRSSRIHLDFADVAVPNKAFKRVVRGVEFDVAELALMTFLMARSKGVPLSLLPVVLFARNPLPYLVCRADHRRLLPQDLAGRCAGVRAYTTTTAVWVRAILADQFCVDLDQVRWVTRDEGHVAGVPDPSNVHRDASADLVAMLLDGTIDAAIVDPVPDDPRIATVVADPTTIYRDWSERLGAQAINHVVVVRERHAQNSEHMRELLRMFRESRELAGAAVDPLLPPIGVEPNRRHLHVAMAVAASQRLIETPLTVDDLITEVVASLT